MRFTVPAALGGETRSTVKLLIVDDSSEIRALLRQIAEQQQHVVVGEAENGKEALAAAA